MTNVSREKRNKAIYRTTFWISQPIVLLSLCLLNACSSSPNLAGSTPFIQLMPSPPSGLGYGQSVTFSASVLNDPSNAGVTWSLAPAIYQYRFQNNTCPQPTGVLASALGTFSNVSTTSATYTAPMATPQCINPAGTTQSAAYIVLTLTSVANPTFSANYTFSFPQTFNITSRTSSTSAYVGAPYNNTLGGQSGTTPYTFQLDPASQPLPPGLSLTSSGVLSGTPTTAGAYPIMLDITDQSSPPLTASVPVLSLPSTPTTTAGAFFTAQVTAASITPGGSTATTLYTDLFSGTLSLQLGAGTPYLLTVPPYTTPSALVALINSDPTLSGEQVTATSVVAGLVTVTGPAGVANTISIVNSSLWSTFTLVVSPEYPFLVQTQSLPLGFQGLPYQQAETATGGVSPYIYSLASSSTLPPGLTLSSNGTINGTPTMDGTYTFTVNVVDSGANSYQQTASQTYTLLIKPIVPLTSFTTKLVNAQAGAYYSQPLLGNGGVAPYAWTITSGSLPQGLTLSPLGLVSGTPTSIGTSSFTVQLSDSASPATTATQTLSITVGPSPLSIANLSLSGGAVGQPYSQAVKAIGGTAPYTYSIIAGAPPVGVSLNSSSGLLSGTPTSIASYNFTLMATDSESPAVIATEPYTVNINPANTGTNTAVLNGSYAFLMRGFDGKGNPVSYVGSFAANGSGAISGGTGDLNGVSPAVTFSNLPISGSYSVGGDNRGTLTLATATQSNTFAIALDSVSGGTAQQGYVVGFDASGLQLTGVFYLQTPSAFTNAALAGPYAFGVAGFTTPSALSAEVGSLVLSGSGGITSGLVDSSIGGAVGASQSVSLGTYAVSAQGRGTASMTVGSNSQNFVIYVVSGNRFLLASRGPITATSPLLSGDAVPQTPSLSTSSLSGTVVLRLERVSSTGSDVLAGLIGFDSAGNVNLYSVDENNAGAISTTTLPASGATYSVGSSGRVTISSGKLLPATIYLVGPNQGYVLDASFTLGIGAIEPQTPGTYAPTSLAGSYALGSTQPLVPGGPLLSGVFTANSSGMLSGGQDVNTTGVLSGDQTIAATPTVASNGRAVGTPTGSTASPTDPIVYIISPVRAVLLDRGSTTPTIQLIQHQ